MSLDERLETITRNLDTLTKIHLDNDREFRERFQRLTEAQEKNTRDIQALTILVERDGENIRALARIAELHQQRLDRLEER
jgi:hypothetical protein